MTWKREDLGDKGVFYDEEIRKTSIPYSLDPPHVEVLRTSMLDFSCSIVSVDERGDTPAKSPLDEAASSWRQHTDPIMRQVYGARDEAVRLHKGGYPETSWAQLFRKWFFEPLEDATSKTSDNVRRCSRNNYYYDGFKTAGETECWTLFDGRNKSDTTALMDFEQKKCPKPDYACFLPIYHLDADPKIPQAYSSEGRNWHESANHLMVEQFSWTLLKKLRSYGLEPTPFKVFHAKPRESSLKCYPWLIVEHKKESNESDERYLREVVCCQAANAAACAIQLNLQTAKYAVKSADCAHVPPIPVITTIGSKVKVWIMYQAQDFHAPTADPHYSWKLIMTNCKEGFIMRAIWEGDITEVEDAAKLQIILENTHTWAMRIFRPLISSHIDTWKCVHLDNNAEASDAHSRRTEMINRNGTASSMIQGFLRDLDPAKFGHGESGDTSTLLLGMLFHMISTAERKSLVEELTGIIDAKITARAEIATSQHPTAGQQSQNLHANLSSVFSQLSTDDTIDNDDPTDADYVDSQPSQSQSSNAHTQQLLDHQSPERPDTGISENISQSRPSKPQGRQIMPLRKTKNQTETSRLSPIPVSGRASPAATVEAGASPQTIASRSSLNAGSATSTKPSSVSELQGTPTPKTEVHLSGFNWNAWSSSATFSSSPSHNDTEKSSVSQTRKDIATSETTSSHSSSHVNRSGARTFSETDQGKGAAPTVSLGTPVPSSIKPSSPSGSVLSPSTSPGGSQAIPHTLDPSFYDSNSNIFGHLLKELGGQ